MSRGKAARAVRTDDEWLTLQELCTRLKVGRSTVYDWKAKGRLPEHIKLPNGQLRFRRSAFLEWEASLGDAA